MRYTNVFEQIDPDGERQIDAEEKMALELYANDGEITITEMAFNLTDIVDKDFGGVSECSFLRIIGEIILQVRKYLKDWHKDIASSYGPNEAECADAAKDILLLILDSVYPEYVEQEER